MSLSDEQFHFNSSFWLVKIVFLKEKKMREEQDEQVVSFLITLREAKERLALINPPSAGTAFIFLEYTIAKVAWCEARTE